MSSYTFAQLRLQFIELADLQPGLTDRAFRLVLHLIIRHLNRTDGTCSIDDTSLARELDCSTDTISRAVACAERSGLLMIKRGQWLRPTHYSMSAQAWQAAEGRRRITGKSAEQGTPQICGGYPAKQPGNTPQKRGAFYRVEIKEKSAGADVAPAAVPSLPDAGLSGTAQVPLTMRETPQSVSVTTRRKMDDRDQRSIGEVLEDTAGITVMPMDTERRSVYARGFSSPTYMVDGNPVWFRIQYGSGPSISDTAIYDRVEVLRGATGLMAGAGDPSVAINMVRKSPTNFPQTSAKLSYGSWNTMRTELDSSGPLSDDGRIRGRFVLAHEDGESFLDRYERKKTIAYGTVEADVGDHGVFTLGYDYQLTRTRNHQFGGLPLIANDGSQLDYDVHVNAGGSNLPLDQKAETAFARYKHSFDNGWEAVGDLSFYRASRIGFLASASWGSPNPDGTGVQLVGGYADTRTEQTNVSATLSGPIELWGRSHDLRFGVVGTFGKDTHRAGRAYNGFEIDYTPITGSIFDWDGAVPGLESNADYLPYVTVTKIDQKAAYGSGRFWLADRLSFIGGARAVWYDYSYTTADSDDGSRTSQEISRDGEWIPYAGLVYDLNDSWSVYGSYTRIFKQPSYRNKDNRIIGPTTGSNYELGVKAALFENQLNFSAAVYRLEQDNLPARDRSITGTLPDGSFPWKSIDGATTQGFEAELGDRVGAPGKRDVEWPDFEGTHRARDDERERDEAELLRFHAAADTADQRQPSAEPAGRGQGFEGPFRYPSLQPVFRWH